MAKSAVSICDKVKPGFSGRLIHRGGAEVSQNFSLRCLSVLRRPRGEKMYSPLAFSLLQPIVAQRLIALELARAGAALADALFGGLRGDDFIQYRLFVRLFAKNAPQPLNVFAR